MSYRNTWCGHVSDEQVGETIKVAGWVHRRRDHGNLVFVDLRDRTGLVQLVFDPARAGQAHAASHVVRSEFVLSAQGRVLKRDPERINPNMATGMVEILVEDLSILAEAKTPPFLPDERVDVDENLRLRYRYIDLRRAQMQSNLRLRDRVVQSARRHFEANAFIEVETPILTKSTPEGARDFLVPSRMQSGAFYALPQSPQLFKQLLMIAGYERYYQIARAFRDEDLRADRQPEHTQIDLEMSFVEEEDIYALVEGMVGRVFSEALGVELEVPFPRLDYREAMARFGSDKPDLRFGMEIVDISDLVAECGFKVFTEAVASGGAVRGLCVAGAGGFSRKDVDDLARVAAVHGAKGLAPLWVEENGVRSSIAKFLSPETMERIVQRMGAASGDLLLFAADRLSVLEPSLGTLRVHLAERLGVPREGWRFTWILNFPMFEYDEREKRWKAQHHPFTRPRIQDAAELSRHPGELGTYAYDLVLNGVELGSGSLRVSDPPCRRPYSPPRSGQGGDYGQVRVPGGGQDTVSLPRWHGLGPGPAGDADGRSGLHPRCHRLPQNSEWVLSVNRSAVIGCE